MDSASARTIVTTDEVPQPIGPYSIGTRSGDLVFLSGNIGTDPATGELVAGGTAAQTRQALENIEKALGAAGSDLKHVMKTTVFLADMDDYAEMNAVYGEFFSSDPPARSAVQVARLPIDAAVEIEVIAIRRAM